MGVTADLTDRSLDGVDEVDGDAFAGFTPVARDCSVEISLSQLAKADRLGCHQSVVRAGAIAHGTEERGIGQRSGWRLGPVEEEAAEPFTILITADEIAHVLAGGAVTAVFDALADETLEFVGERHVHRRHTETVALDGNLCHNSGVTRG